MKKTTVLIIVLGLVAIGLGAYGLITKTSGQKSAKIESWSLFENDYVSFEYPSSWKLEDRTGLLDSDWELIRVVMESPERKSDYYPNYRITLVVEDPFGAGYADDHTFSEDELNRLRKAVKDEDVDVYFSDHDNPLLDRSNIEILNGEKVFVRASGNDKVFYGGNFTFMKNGKEIRIDFRDYTDEVIKELSGTNVDNLIEIFKNKPYYQSMKSVVLK